MESEPQGRARRTIAALKRLDSGERMIALARAGRRRLPGDHRYGDPLSLSGSEPPALIGRGLTAMGEERPSALRELGMGALLPAVGEAVERPVRARGGRGSSGSATG